jgi:UDP-glucose 4-epimerase
VAKQKVLITGGAGFIGSHLAEALLAAGHDVTAIDDLSTGSMDNIRVILDNPRFHFVCDTVRNAEMMHVLVEKCDVVYHLAAAVGVQLIVDDPVHTIETNIHGSEVILNIANKFRKKILLASTSEVYGKSENVPFREDDDTVMGSTRFSRWAYACSKAIDEFLGMAYYEQYGLPVVVARFFNTVGPRQTGRYGMVIPRFVERALKNEPLLVYGTGKQSEIRYISYEEAYGKPVDDMMRRTPCLDRLEATIGFRPTTSLETILTRVIEDKKSNSQF